MKKSFIRNQHIKDLATLLSVLVIPTSSSPFGGREDEDPPEEAAQEEVISRQGEEEEVPPGVRPILPLVHPINNQMSPEAGEEVPPSVRPILPLSPPSCGPSVRTAGNISRFADNWKLFINNAFVLRIVEEGYKIQLIDNVRLPVVISTPSKHKKDILATEIRSYLESGTIRVMVPLDTDVVSRAFTVPKADGSH